MEWLYAVQRILRELGRNGTVEVHIREGAVRRMKVWYSKKWDMYVPVVWWDEEDKPDDVVEMEITKEVIECNGGSDEPYAHAGRWEQEFYDENWMHSIGTKIPWKQGKYKITIEEIPDA